MFARMPCVRSGGRRLPVADWREADTNMDPEKPWKRKEMLFLKKSDYRAEHGEPLHPYLAYGGGRQACGFAEPAVLFCL